LLESFVADLRFALRWLRQSPGFTLVAVASLAIGIGFNAALFTIVDALLFKPLPVSRPDRLVDVFTSDSTGQAPFGTTSYPDYLDLGSENDVFEELVGYSPMFGALGADTAARLAMGEIVTGNYFRALGVPAFMGRTIQPDDDRKDAPAVAVVSYRYWTRDLGSSPDAVGRTLRIRGNPYTIVGVAPRTFTGMVPVLSPDLWVSVSSSLDVEPVGLHDVVPSPTGTNRLERRGDRWLFLRGRLKTGATIDHARANLELVMSRLAATHPATNKDRRIALKATNDVHFHPSADPQILPIAQILMAVVGLVLLVACANVASMLLARASARQKEIGIRLAIGASRGRLVRQLVTESLLLVVAGAAAGLLLAWWITSIVGSLSLPFPIPLVFNLRIDGRVLTFTLLATSLAALLAGVVPALQASKPNLTADLRGEQVGRTAGRHWTLRSLLVAGQMAVTAVLLVVAALLTRSLIAAQRTNLGFPVDRIALVSIDASQLRYDRDRTQLFFDQTLASIRAIPGVEGAALATRPVFSVNSNRWEIWIPGLHQPGAHGATVEVTSVSRDYFSAMSVPIVSGRAFTDDDRPDTPRVAIVNETMARRFWPGQNPIGQTFRTRNSEGPVFQIVGVSADHKVTTVSESPTPFLHVARRQQPNPYSAFIARTRGGDASALLRDMRRAIHAVEPNLAFIENQTMEGEVGLTLFPVRASAWLVSGVGLMAMLLAAIGLYGVIAYSVARRTREIGIRMALGARQTTVVGLVMRQGLGVAIAGLAAGCTVAAALAFVAARQISLALYGVGAGDPASWLAAVGVILLVSALANLIPAWRAARVHPSEALRAE
jgi:macrolide transport system ATP-binding/permease protein